MLTGTAVVERAATELHTLLAAGTSALDLSPGLLGICITLPGSEPQEVS